jgi:hypothetical protein
MKAEHREDENTLIMGGILSFHQEKRTALRAIRIGISMAAAQVSLLGLMKVSSAFYIYIRTRHWTVPFVMLNSVFFGLTVFFLIVSLIRIHRLDRKISEFKQK